MDALVVTPQHGGNDALILEDLKQTIEVPAWHIVYDHLIDQLFATLHLNVACKSLTPDKQTFRRWSDKTAWLGMHLSFRGCERTVGLEIGDECERSVDRHRTARAIAWLRANNAKPLHVEDLATTARMGVSTLRHHFRALTAMRPLQYQKKLRLQMARQRMLMDGMDATSAAYEVGYESVSQFNREYSRFFGQPPMRDIKTLRDNKVVSINAA
jgi:AraC-like DNA-binding protein